MDEVALAWLAEHERAGCVIEGVCRPRPGRAEVFYRHAGHAWTVVGYSTAGKAVVTAPTDECVQGMVEMHLTARGWQVVRSFNVMPAALLGGHGAEVAYSTTAGVKTWVRLVLQSRPFGEHRPKAISLLPTEA